LFQGNLLVGDFDQIEMRVMAHLSQDPNLLKVFREGQDPHVLTTQAIFGDVDMKSVAPGAAASYRDVGKQLNYAMGYGAMPKRIAQTLCLFGFPTSVEVAGGYFAEMQRFYRRYFEWKVEEIAAAKKRGYVDTIGGFRRHLRATFKDTANWKLTGYGERQVISSKVQGSAADVIKCGMIRAERDFPQFLFLAQVHDEAVWDYGTVAPNVVTLRQLQDVMENGHGFELSVPMGFEPVLCDNWGEKSTGGADWFVAEGETDGE
jgi:DNA polymerase-1